MKTLPLYILAGFLGSGKTTALRRALRASKAQNLRPYVILNDLENAEIDARLLKEITQDINALTGACICCDDPMSLVDQINQIPFDQFDCIFLEANGSTDLWALLEWLSHSFKGILNPIQVIGIVDGEHFGQRGWAQILETEQLRTASKMFVSKQDKLNSAQKLALWENLRSEFPRAIFQEPEDWHQNTQRPSFKYQLAPQAHKTRLLNPRRIQLAHAQSHMCSAHSWDIPLHWAKPEYEQWLNQLPTAILRVKGLLFLENKWQILQWVPGSQPHWEELFFVKPEDPMSPALIGIGSSWDPYQCAP